MVARPGFEGVDRRPVDRGGLVAAAL